MEISIVADTVSEYLLLVHYCLLLTLSAAIVATQLLNDFTSIRFSLLVGIGGGIPGDNEDDIRLGDVVVSKPTATFGGVVQFDRG
jgi:nucleoside phosphorylase